MPMTTIIIDRLHDLKVKCADQDVAMKTVVNELVNVFLDGEKIKCDCERPCPTCLGRDWVFNMYSIDKHRWYCVECWQKV